jgi:hypothetical protein
MRKSTAFVDVAFAGALFALVGCSNFASATNPGAHAMGSRDLVPTAAGLAEHAPTIIAPSLRSLLHPVARNRAAWISPDVRTGEALLYVSQFLTNDIQIYRQTGKNQSPIGMITKGIDDPGNMWVTPNGDLYVVNEDSHNVLVFAKGHLEAYKSLADPGEYPAGVTVDSDGTVYVTNYFATSGGAGSVSVYAPGATTPTAIYTVPNNEGVFFDALDAAGRLYVNYIDANGVGAMVKFYRGSAIAHLTAVTFGFPESMQFDNTGDLIAIDQGGPFAGIYELPSSAPSFTFGRDNLCPSGLVLVRNERQVYISDEASGVIHQYSYPGGQEDNTISSGLGTTSPPGGLAADPGAPI